MASDGKLSWDSNGAIVSNALKMFCLKVYEPFSQPADKQYTATDQRKCEALLYVL